MRHPTFRNRIKELDGVCPGLSASFAQDGGGGGELPPNVRVVAYQLAMLAVLEQVPPRSALARGLDRAYTCVQTATALHGHDRPLLEHNVMTHCTCV